MGGKICGDLKSEEVLPGETLLGEAGEELTISHFAGKSCSLKITLREIYMRPVL